MHCIDECSAVVFVGTDVAEEDDEDLAKSPPYSSISASDEVSCVCLFKVDIFNLIHAHLWLDNPCNTNSVCHTPSGLGNRKIYKIYLGLHSIVNIYVTGCSDERINFLSFQIIKTNKLQLTLHTLSKLR